MQYTVKYKTTKNHRQIGVGKNPSMMQENPKQNNMVQSGRPGGGDRNAPLEPGMALVELLYFFLLGCIVHLPLHSIPYLWQGVLIHREIPATFPYISAD